MLTLYTKCVRRKTNRNRFLSVLVTALAQLLHTGLAYGKSPTNILEYKNEKRATIQKSDLMKNRMR